MYIKIPYFIIRGIFRDLEFFENYSYRAIINIYKREYKILAQCVSSINLSWSMDSRRIIFFTFIIYCHKLALSTSTICIWATFNISDVID